MDKEAKEILQKARDIQEFCERSVCDKCCPFARTDGECLLSVDGETPYDWCLPKVEP